MTSRPSFLGFVLVVVVVVCVFFFFLFFGVGWYLFCFRHTDQRGIPFPYSSKRGVCVCVCARARARARVHDTVALCSVFSGYTGQQPVPWVHGRGPSLSCDESPMFRRRQSRCCFARPGRRTPYVSWELGACSARVQCTERGRLDRTLQQRQGFLQRQLGLISPSMRRPHIRRCLLRVKRGKTHVQPPVRHRLPDSSVPHESGG